MTFSAMQEVVQGNTLQVMSNSSASPESAYPGQRLGLPEDGPGSIASYGRRVVGLIIDWGLACLLAWQFFNYHPVAIMVLFVAITALTITLFGGSIGHLLCGMRLNTVAGKAPGWWRPWIRQTLMVFVIPALITDVDQRGAHDVLSGLVLRRYVAE